MKRVIVLIFVILFSASICYGARWKHCKDCSGQYGASWYGRINFTHGYKNLQDKLHQSINTMRRLKRQIIRNAKNEYACCREAELIYVDRRDELISILETALDTVKKLPSNPLKEPPCKN